MHNNTMQNTEIQPGMKAEVLPLFFQQVTEGLKQAPEEVRRLFHGRGRTYAGLEQITCDWISQHLLIQLFRPVSELFLVELERGLNELQAAQAGFAIKSISIQHRYQQGSPTQVLFGEVPQRVEAVESGLKFGMNISANQNSGLFLDMRLGRRWVNEQAKDKNVLNLFAYTCGFSVAAVDGGARQVVNIDMARSSLNQGRENHRLNGHDTKKVKFLAHDVFKSWSKLKRFGPYDLIISDPPSFQKGSFALTKDYQKVLRRLPELLSEDGEVLACVNSPDVTPQFLIDSMAEHAPELVFVERLPNPPEFREVDEEKGLKVLRFCQGQSES